MFAWGSYILRHRPATFAEPPAGKQNSSKNDVDIFALPVAKWIIFAQFNFATKPLQYVRSRKYYSSYVT